MGSKRTMGAKNTLIADADRLQSPTRAGDARFLAGRPAPIVRQVAVSRARGYNIDSTKGQPRKILGCGREQETF